MPIINRRKRNRKIYKGGNINNIKMVKHTCEKCGHEWEGKEKPVACPRCKRYDWKSEREDNQNEEI